MFFNVDKLHWTREPLSFNITKDKIEIITSPHTDLWQRTYYHFRNDNAPVLQMKNSFHLLLRQILIAKSDLTNVASSYI